MREVFALGRPRLRRAGTGPCRDYIRFVVPGKCRGRQWSAVAFEFVEGEGDAGHLTHAEGIGGGAETEFRIWGP